MFFTIIVFIITLLILVIIHELGHFLMAKYFNIKVLEFGFGIPPRAFGKKIGETLVSLNWLPFGGFVRLLGEDEVDKSILENIRSFAHQAVWKRTLVVVAGVLMNLFLAWILFWIVLGVQGFRVQIPLLSHHQFIGVSQTNETVVLVDQVVKNSPADLAGIKSEDRVIAINDQFIKDSDDLVTKTKQQAGKKIKITLSDAQKTNFRNVEVTPRINPPKGQGALGISLGSFGLANLSYEAWWQKLIAGPLHSLNLTVYSWDVLTQMVGLSIAKRDLTPVSQNVAGPIGITSIINQILSVKNPLIPFVDFIAALSLNLSLVNILPFPGLDGGRFFFLIIEAFTKKRVHPTVEKYIHSVGLVILLSLIILVTFSDIKKLLVF